MLENTVWLHTISAQNGLQLTDDMLRQYDTFVGLLLEWNKKINLISRRDEEAIWSAHILHSLSILLKLQIPRGSVVLDLGTGGGLPGLPLKIARPDLQLTLLDSTQKKINVVKEIARSLKLENVNAVWGRAEDLGRQALCARNFDIVVARAVASLKDLVHWSAPFLKEQTSGAVGQINSTDEKKLVGGPALIALKGGDLEGEIAQIRHLTAVKKIELVNLTLHGSRELEEGEKKIVVVSLQIGQSKKPDKQ
jgi:16S rRNA (guanine(527)-N(7))-methyltransferase RsmG